MINRTLLIFSTITISLVLLLLSFHGNYAYHFRSDTDGFYYPRANHLLKHGNFTNLGYNEYQPGALLFFISLTPLLLVENSVEIYRSGLFALNIFIFSLTTYLIARFYSKKNALIYQVLVLFAGPIVLSRFELYMFLLLLLAIRAMQEKQLWRSGFWLGIATATKIFPILLIPYFGWLSLQTSSSNKLNIFSKKYLKSISPRQALRWLSGLTTGGLLIIGGYCLVFQVQAPQLLQDMSIHSRKPVHLESVWASALTVYHKLASGSYPIGKGDLGIAGLHPDYELFHRNFFNYFWIFPWLVAFSGMLLKKVRTRVSVEYVMMLLTLFLVFSKILTPQYLLWFSLLAALIKFPKKKKIKQLNRYYVLIFLCTLALFLSQYIYPLKYSDLLGGFYQSASHVHVFYSLFIRNLLLIIITLYLLYSLTSEKSS